MTPISVLILTRNEETGLADCLRSVGWCDDVVVLDSYSTDRTAQIAADGSSTWTLTSGSRTNCSKSAAASSPRTGTVPSWSPRR